MRWRLVLAAVLAILLQRDLHGQARTFYVDNTQGDCTDATSNNGQTFTTPLCTPVRAAALTTLAGDTVEITSSLYRLSAFGTGTTTSLTETTQGVTWRGMGDSPDDVRIVNSTNSISAGVTITKDPAYDNLFYFDPPAGWTRLGAIAELGRWTDSKRPTPGAYSDLDGGQQQGVDAYWSLHNRTQASASDLFPLWRSLNPSISGTTVTLTDTDISSRDQFSQHQVGKPIRLVGNQYTIVSVISNSQATISSNLGTIPSTQAVTSITRSGTVATVTTATPHGYSVGMQPYVNPPDLSPNVPFRGHKVITAVPTTTSFTFTVADSGITSVSGTSNIQTGYFYGELWVTACNSGAIVNAFTFPANQETTYQCKPPDLESCLDGIDAAPGTWCQDDAPQDNTTAPDDEGYDSTWRVWFHPRRHQRLASLTSVGTTATGTCTRYCNYATGDSVIITGATPSAYNGTYTITIVGDMETSQSFTYTFAGAGGVAATGDVESLPDGETLSMELTKTGGGPTCVFNRNNSHVSNLTCIAFPGVSDRMEPGQVGAPVALEVGGSNSHIHDVWAIGGKLKLDANATGGGLNDFLLEDFFASSGFRGDDLQTQIPLGYTVQDGEIAGQNGVDIFGKFGPWGSDNGVNAALFQRLTIHDNLARQASGGAGCIPHVYDWAEDPVNDQYPGGFRWVALGSTHTGCGDVTANLIHDGKYYYSPHPGGLGPAKYVNFYNNVWQCVSDYMEIFPPATAPVDLGTVRIWNNTFHCNGIQVRAGQNPAGQISYWNNFHEGYNFWTNDEAFDTSGHNYIWRANSLGGGNACPIITNDGRTLAQIQALGTGLEVNSIFHDCSSFTLASANTIFEDYEIKTGTDTGGDDFRPVSGSPLINNGSDTHCAHVPADGECDIGAYEAGEDALGPPQMKERFFIAGTTGGDSPPSNVAPVADAGPDDEIDFPDIAQLSGSANEPVSTIAWAKFSGPGTVTFTPSDAVFAPNAQFSEAGTYVLRLTVTDSGALSDTDDVTITVNEVSQPNTAPNVNAGLDQELAIGDFVADLDGTVTDNGAFSVLWEQIGGPPQAPSVTFGSTSSVDTTVTFYQPGNYTLRLNATDTASPALTTCDDITITVQSGPPPPGGSTPKRVRLRIKL